MNKIVSALLVGLFAVSVNAFAADAAPAAVKAEATPAAAVAPATDVAKHTAAPAKKAKHHHKKAAVKAAPAAK